MAVFSKSGGLQLAFAVAIIVGVFAFGDAYDSEEHAQNLSQALIEIDAHETLALHGRTYSLRAGSVFAADEGPILESERLRVLQLAYALAFLRYDPLLSLGGTDTAALREEISSLETVRDELAALQTSAAATHRVSHDLFPVEFLLAAASLEDARRKALSDGTEAAYAAYALLLDRTISKGKESINQFSTAYENATAERTSRGASLNGIITEDSTRNALSQIETGFDKLEIESARRSACMKGLVRNCGINGISSTPGEPTVRNESLMREILGIYDNARSLLRSERRIVALENSACLGGLHGTDYFEYMNIMNTPLKAYAYIGDIIVRPTTKDTGPVVTWFASQNVSHLPYDPFVFYTCPLIASDIARIDSVVSISERLGVPEDKVLYEKDVLELLSVALEEEGTSSEVDIETLRELYLEYTNRSAALQDTLFDIVHGLETVITMRNKGIPTDIREETLFSTHSGYYTLFMAHNRSLGSGAPTPYEEDTSNAFWDTFALYSRSRASIDDQRMARAIELFFSVHTR